MNLFTEEDQERLQETAELTLKRKQQGLGDFASATDMKREVEHATLYSLSLKFLPIAAWMLGFRKDPHEDAAAKMERQTS